jgi:hypothetical protein
MEKREYFYQGNKNKRSDFADRLSQKYHKIYTNSTLRFNSHPS